MEILVVALIGELAGEDLNVFVNKKRTCVGYAEASSGITRGCRRLTDACVRD